MHDLAGARRVPIHECSLDSRPLASVPHALHPAPSFQAHPTPTLCHSSSPTPAAAGASPPSLRCQSEGGSSILASGTPGRGVSADGGEGVGGQHTGGWKGVGAVACGGWVGVSDACSGLLPWSPCPLLQWHMPLKCWQGVGCVSSSCLFFLNQTQVKGPVLTPCSYLAKPAQVMEQSHVHASGLHPPALSWSALQEVRQLL